MVRNKSHSSSSPSFLAALMSLAACGGNGDACDLDQTPWVDVAYETPAKDAQQTPTSTSDSLKELEDSLPKVRAAAEAWFDANPDRVAHLVASFLLQNTDVEEHIATAVRSEHRPDFHQTKVVDARGGPCRPGSVGSNSRRLWGRQVLRRRGGKGAHTSGSRGGVSRQCERSNHPGRR